VTGVVLGLDQGTSSTRCLAVNRSLDVVGAAGVPVAAAFPGPGLVEQDPDELVASARAAIAGALESAGAGAGDVAAVGIANQTETFVVCERSSGRPVHPAIVWQDRRTADRCAELVRAGHAASVRERTGLELDATFPATKIAWLLDAVPGGRAAAEAGELAYHDVGGWLVRHLCGAELCDAGNAGRTMLCALGGEDWDDGLLELFGVPRPLLAPIVDSDAIGGVSESGLPVSAVLGDQPASLFGLGAHEPGTTKVTLGTGAFILAQAGPAAVGPPDGVLVSCAWRRHGSASYALEGFVPAAGAAVSWFTELGVLPAPSELDRLLTGAGDEDGAVVCVPAFQGLGTPSWNASARAALLGLSRATSRAQIARAVIDGVLHQVTDALEAISRAMPVAALLVDGGLARSEWTIRRLAELAGVPVRRAVRAEATAVGAAMVAGAAVGFYTETEVRVPVAVDLEAEPSWSATEREARRDRWARAVALAARWPS
jgi:glycerol kinase